MWLLLDVVLLISQLPLRRLYFLVKSVTILYLGLPETGGLAHVMKGTLGIDIGEIGGATEGDTVEKVALVLDGFVGPDGVVCGILRSYDSWIREMVQQGKRVIIYSPFAAESIEEHFDGGVKAYEIEALRMRYIQQEYYATSYTTKNAAQVYDSLKRDRPDVVHLLFDGISLPLFNWACAALNLPIVAIMHTDLAVLCSSVGLPEALGQTVLAGQRSFALGVDGIATRSRSFQKIMRHRGWSVDHVVKPHVNVDVFRPFEDEETQALREEFTFNHPETLLIMYAGRLDPDKSVDDLLTIMERVEGVSLVLVGGGSMEKYLAKKHGEDNHIFCRPGFVDHPTLAKMYNAADLHITASQMETLGNTVLESLACGTPVLTPRAQGFVDTVRDGVDGMLWRAGDLDDAVEKLNAFKNDIALRQTLVDGAQEVAKNGELACAETIRDLFAWYAACRERRVDHSAVYSNAMLGLATLNMLAMAAGDISVIRVLKRYLERPRSK